MRKSTYMDQVDRRHLETKRVMRGMVLMVRSLPRIPLSDQTLQKVANILSKQNHDYYSSAS